MGISADQIADGEREIELKLLAGPDVLARLRKSALIGRLGEGRAVSRRLLSVYYDTPDLALRNEGLTLRVRKTGSVYTQTVKSDDIHGRAASIRLELEASLPDERPDPALISNDDVRAFVTKQAAGPGLRRIYETDVRRTQRQLVMPEGDCIELAIDKGVIRAGASEEPVSELELELQSGRPAALLGLARAIADRFDVRLGVLSKPARGYALATGHSGIVPVKSAPPPLSPSMTVEEACCCVLESTLSQIIRNEPSVVTARDPEGVHQMRVGLRRMRSATASFSETGLEEWLAPLAREARWFASQLGKARDLDVFVDEMLKPVETTLPDHTGLARLRLFAQEHRKAAWTKARSAIASRRFTAFVLSVAAVVEERPWRQSGPGARMGATSADTLASPVRDLARRVLHDHYAHAREKAEGFDTLTTEARHALRIELKKLRYSADFFAPLYPKKAPRPFLKALSDLQDVFGHLNDAAVAEGLSRKLVKRAKNDGKKGRLREAVGLVVGWHGHLAADNWRRARKRWRAFEKVAPFWVD